MLIKNKQKKVLIIYSKSTILACLPLIKNFQIFDFCPSLITFGKQWDFGFTISPLLKAKSSYVAAFVTAMPCSVWYQSMLIAKALFGQINRLALARLILPNCENWVILPVLAVLTVWSISKSKYQWLSINPKLWTILFLPTI